MKALRISLGALAALLLTVLVVVIAAWTWIGAGTSLSTSLELAARYLPAGQTLEVKNVTGSLRGGGTIGWLRWRSGELSVEADDVSVAWALRPMLDRELRLGKLAARHVRIDDRRPPSAPTPLTNLSLPIKIDVPFSVDTLEWAGPPALQITGTTGHYSFDSKQHIFDAANVHISSGTYKLKGSLQAQAPMALSAQLQGTVQTAVPSSTQKMTVQAQASVQGELAGLDAALALQAQLQPELQDTNAGKAVPKQAMQASVTARILPWQPQPVANAKASWQALNLAALWPQAPQTLLAGDAAVTPAGKGWQASIQLTNSQSGPWDKQRLPLESLKTHVVFADGQWNIESLQGAGAGGLITAQGKVGTTKLTGTPTTSNSLAWQGNAALKGINPAALDSRLAATVLDGQLTAQQTPAGLTFDAQVQQAPGKAAAALPDASNAATLAGLRLKAIHTQGLWQAPRLTLETITVQTDDAQLQGKLTFDTVSLATDGKLALTLPGAQATLEGKISSTQGQGDLNLRVLDTALTSRWLARWPGMPASLAQDTLQGAAELTGHWQGGWQHQGQALQIQAALRAPKLDRIGADQALEQTLRLRDLQADLSGTLSAMNLNTQGQAEIGTRRFGLQAKARGGKVNDGVWQAQVDAAQFTAQNSLQPGLWTLQLNDRVAIGVKQSGTAQAIEVGSGTLRLTGPAPGTATLNWQPVHWSQQDTRSEWRTQGNLQALPLAWLDLIGQTKMTNLGLRGDLLFGGQWDATGGETLRLRATLARTSGDLQMLTDTAALGTVNAGVRDARLTLTAEGERLGASLVWDSERAGQAKATLNTSLKRAEWAWSWPLDAPVEGTLQAKMPPIGAWSLLAPPGWRLRGTLDANAVLSGTRGTPQWRGALTAQDMAVRSVVDGIDFSNGTLRANLEGQRLDIVEFNLRGAGGGNGGGLLTIKGAVDWLPATNTASTLAQRLRMELEATAQALRMSTRVDRKLVLSGKITARLSDASLAIRGALKADQALFILPEDSAPQLGDDVVLRKVGKVASTPAPAAPTGVRIKPNVIITLDLGPDFQVRGRGLVTRLKGSLELVSTGERDQAPRLTGVLTTVRGTYKAYGQQLDIEEGVLRFSGPFDNPVLDILAIRPNTLQRVGVQISGNVLSPVVRLYAEPDLPDAEKLAWLVLGRSAANGGAESAVLQQAALALLGGNGKGLSSSLTEALGLDELSVRGSSATNADGTVSGATVTLGKRVSRDFYVAYERSLAGAFGTFYIFYDLSRRFTLRAQTGEQSAIDLIFTIRYD